MFIWLYVVTTQAHVGRKRRERSPALQEVGDASAYEGVRGRKRTVSEILCQHSSLISRRGDFIPFVTLNTQPAQHRNKHQHVDWQHLGPEGDYQATDRPSGTDRRSRHQREREQQSMHWEEQLPELVFRRTCFLANECQRRQQLQLSMQAEFVERVSTADKECSSCGTAIHLQPVLPAAPITYTGIHAHVTVDKPQFLCTCCGTQLDLHPVSLDCFPAGACALIHPLKGLGDIACRINSPGCMHTKKVLRGYMPYSILRAMTSMPQMCPCCLSLKALSSSSMPRSCQILSQLLYTLSKSMPYSLAEQQTAQSTRLLLCSASAFVCTGCSTRFSLM